MGKGRVIHGDARSLPIADSTVDTICTDPPYGLHFMGKAWDHGVPGPDFWREALRVARPGCWLLAFGGTRTWHRLAVAIEESGWQIRDTICWLYGSGFPKSLDISKAIDKAAGAEREVVGAKNNKGRAKAEGWGMNADTGADAITAPATESAQLWNGYGTALKPAWEPIILARAPLDGTNAHNALTHGCGGLWIEGGRIGTDDNLNGGAYSATGERSPSSFVLGGDCGEYSQPSGRWPANLLLDPEAAVMLDAQSGELKSGNLSPGHGSGNAFGVGNCDKRPRAISAEYGGDSGGASRFFYCAKPSRAERNAGLTGDGRKRDASRNADQPSMHGGNGNPYNRGARPVRNHHPTVKPVALLRHLLRLTRPPTGGLVLDPFCGSGSTGIAAVLEDRAFVGVDISDEYCQIARARIRHAKRAPWDYDPDVPKPPEADPRQQTIFDVLGGDHE